MFGRVKIVSYITVLLFFALAAHAQRNTFSMSDSVLLFSSYDHGLVLVTPENSLAIHPSPGSSRTLPVGVPSLSRSGDLVSWGFPVADDATKRWKVRCAVAVYSVPQQRWRTRGDYSHVGATALSPDETQVAFFADETDSESSALFLLDVGSGRISKLKKLIASVGNWSPDAKMLTLHIMYAKAPKIAVYDIASGNLRELDEGIYSAWSPSGEWIAYIDASRQRVRLIHPDGTGGHVVKDERGRMFGYRYFGLAPVWSPDSTRLLLNEYKGDGDSQEVVLPDLKTGKLTKKSSNGLSVLGWAHDLLPNTRPFIM